MVCAAAAVRGRRDEEMSAINKGQEGCANASAWARVPNVDSSKARVPAGRSYDTSFCKASANAASSTSTSEINTSEPVPFHITVASAAHSTRNMEADAVPFIKRKRWAASWSKSTELGRQQLVAADPTKGGRMTPSRKHRSSAAAPTRPFGLDGSARLDPDLLKREM